MRLTENIAYVVAHKLEDQFWNMRLSDYRVPQRFRVIQEDLQGILCGFHRENPGVPNQGRKMVLRELQALGDLCPGHQSDV